MAGQLGPDDLFDLKFLRGACLSPDGHHLAFAVSRTDQHMETIEIWVADAKGEGKRRVSHPGIATAPRWSPDGRSIAFVADGRLRVAQFPSLAISDPLTPEHLLVQGAPSWSPDNARLVVSLLERTTVQGARRIRSNYFRAEGLGFVEGLSQHIYIIEHSTRALRCLTRAATFCSQPEWSPCGRRILFFATETFIPFASYSPRLLTIDVADGEITEVMGSPWYITCARWLPGGEHIAVAAAKESTLTVPIPSLWVIDRCGTHAELRSPGMPANIGCGIHHDMPAWDLTQVNTLTVLDRSTIFVTVQKGGSVEIWRVALEGDIALQSIINGKRSCIVLDANGAIDALLFAVTELTSPTELWRSTLNGTEEERLTSLNDEVLSHWPETDLDQFVFESADGTPIDAWFMAPAKRQGPVPTVLFIHGGPFSATGFAFRYDFLLLASQGLGVLFANFRGSAGYGEPFMRAIIGDWGERGYPDHIGAVDAAVAHGFADANRLAVWGLSHGGFATCWIVGHTNRFKAAIAEAGCTNFTTLYYSTDAPDVIRRDLGGRPHEIPDVYRARSPMTYGHRCTTPTMLLHGEDDLRCPIGEADQFHRLLRDTGCTTELFRIPDCNHLGDSAGPLSARRAQNEALISWFKQHL
jgi:dipeptidyl aminopeptidase/acylaminoacyl peptidase